MSEKRLRFIPNKDSKISFLPYVPEIHNKVANIDIIEEMCAKTNIDLKIKKQIHYPLQDENGLYNGKFLVVNEESKLHKILKRF